MKKPITQYKYFMESLLIFATASWGLAFIWIKQVINAGVDANAFIAIRYGLAALLLLPFCIKELKAVTRTELAYGVLIGMLMYAAMMFQTYGLMYTTPANSGFITTAYVVFVPFTSWLIMGRRPKRSVYLAVPLCLCGLYVLTMGPGEGLEVNVGNLLTLLCAVTWSFQVPVISRGGARCNIKILTLLPLFVMLIISLPVSLIRGGFDFTGVDIKAAALPIVCSALFPTLLAGVAQAYAQRYIDPSKAAIIYTLESLFACVVSVALGMERLTASLFLGGGLIITAILVNDRLGRRKGEEGEDAQQV